MSFFFFNIDLGRVGIAPCIDPGGTSVVGSFEASLVVPVEWGSRVVAVEGKLEVAELVVGILGFLELDEVLVD